VKWERIGRKSYSLKPDSIPVGDIQAFVFGADRPQLWAWKAFWHGGSMGRVAHSFQQAKDRAERVVEEVMHNGLPALRD
jgi:hypothetical protein